MSYGDIQWGRQEWGVEIVFPVVTMTLTGAVNKDVDVSVTLTGIVGGDDIDVSMLVTATTNKDTTVSFGVTYSVPTVPIAALRNRTMAPLLLVQIDLPGGNTLRICGRRVIFLGFLWEARIIEVDDVLRSIGSGSDDVSIAIEDTDNFGPRLRELFRANDPEGSLVTIILALEDEAESDRVTLFVGRISKIKLPSRSAVTIDVVRTELVEDRLLGEVLTDDTYPNAPKASLGRTIPIPFGVVPYLESVVIETNEISALKNEIDAVTTAIQMTDASNLQSSGSVIVGSEQIDYTGISETSQELTGVTRGAGGTVAASHPAGAEVRENGNFVCLFASRPVGNISVIKIEGPGGVLGEPVPSPTLIDCQAATITWPEIPRIRLPDTAAVVIRVNMQDTGDSNTALNPELAARESPKFASLDAAKVGVAGNLHLVTSSEELGEPGDIEKCWLVVVFDSGGSSISGSVSCPAFESLPFQLTSADVTPKELARLDDKATDEIYEVEADDFDINTGTSLQDHIPSEIIESGLWFAANPQAAVDGNPDTFTAAYIIIAGGGEGDVGGVGQRPFRAKVPDNPPVNSEGFKLESAKLVVVAGWDEGAGLTAPLRAFLARTDETTGQYSEISGTSLDCSTEFLVGGAKAIRGISTFEVEIPVNVLGDDLELLQSLEVVVVPLAQESLGLWVLREVTIQVVLSQETTISTIIRAKTTFTNAFEVTDFVKAGIESSDWGAFSDPLRLGSVSTFAGISTLNVLRVHFAVLHRPYVEATSLTPRVFATVEGEVPSGDPTEIASSLVTTAAPHGLGLDPSRIAGADHALLATELKDAGVRLDFAITKPTSTTDLLVQLAKESDCRSTWDRSTFRLIRKASPSLLEAIPVVARYTPNDILAGSLRVSKEGVDAVANRYEARFAHYPPEHETSKTSLANNPVSEGLAWGRRTVTPIYGLTQDQVSADLITALNLERTSFPRWSLSFEIPLIGLSLRFGDSIAIDHPDFFVIAAEVQGLNFKPDTGPDKIMRVEVQAIAWLL